MRAIGTVGARAAAAALIAVAAAACGAQEHPAATAPPSSAPGGPALPFIENDFPAALARARAASLPLFVEVWAPW